MALNAKQRTFVNEYLKSRNATKAAIKAGYSKKSARSAGSSLLTNPDILAKLEASLARATEKAELTAADVLAEIRKLAFVKLKDAYAPDGTFLNLHEMPEDVQAALVGLESEEILAGPRGMKIKIGETKKVKMADKVRSLEMLAKHFKLLTDVTEINPGSSLQVNLTMPSNGSEVIQPKPDDKDKPSGS